MRKPKPLAIDALDARMIVVAAFRYYLGRQSISVWAFTEWLCQRWPHLDEGTQQIIAREIEESFRIDDDQRKAGKEYFRLGMDCDRAAWAKVRTLYRTPTCCLCGKELPSTVEQNVHMDGERSCTVCAPPECEVCGKPFQTGEQIIPNKSTRRARHPYKCLSREGRRP